MRKRFLPRVVVMSLWVGAALTCGSQAFAVCEGIYCRDEVLTALFPISDRVRVATSGDETRLACGPYIGDEPYLTLFEDNPRFREIYEALLSAFERSTRIVIRVREGTSGCEIYWIKISK